MKIIWWKLFAGDQDIHGKYDCRAWNKYGEDMATTEVSGKAAPANFKSEYMSQEDREFVLEWVVSRSVEIILSQLFKTFFRQSRRVAILTTEIFSRSAPAPQWQSSSWRPDSLMMPQEAGDQQRPRFTRLMRRASLVKWLFMILLLLPSTWPELLRGMPMEWAVSVQLLSSQPSTNISRISDTLLPNPNTRNLFPLPQQFHYLSSCVCWSLPGSCSDKEVLNQFWGILISEWWSTRHVTEYWSLIGQFYRITNYSHEIT